MKPASVFNVARIRIDERQRAAFEADRLKTTPTFEQAARQVYADIAPGFRNKKHSAQWITTLESYAFPSIGQAQVDQLTTADFRPGSETHLACQTGNRQPRAPTL